MPVFRSTQLFAATALCLGLSATAASQSQEQQNLAKIAEFGGSMHAVAEICGDYTPAQLAEMKAGQQAASAALPAAQFEALFTTGYNDTKKKIATGSDAQRQGMCQQFQAMQAAQAAAAPKP